MKSKLKDTVLFDIPSVLLNNIIDENGDIKDESSIPKELLQMFSHMFEKTSKQEKLQRVS